MVVFHLISPYGSRLHLKHIVSVDEQHLYLVFPQLSRQLFEPYVQVLQACSVVNVYPEHPVPLQDWVHLYLVVPQAVQLCDKYPEEQETKL